MTRPRCAFATVAITDLCDMEYRMRQSGEPRRAGVLEASLLLVDNGSARHLYVFLDLLDVARELGEAVAGPGIDTDGHFTAGRFFAALDEFGERLKKGGGEVVDAVVSEILKEFQGKRFACPGETGHEHETPALRHRRRS